MKKNMLLLIIAVFFIPEVSLSKEPSANGFPWAPVILLSSDALLVGASIAAVIQQNTLAADYETLVENLGELDDAEYWRLKYEKEKVAAAEDLVLISTIAAGTALLYTAFDYFLLHNVFKGDVKVQTGYDAENRAYTMAVNYKY